MRIVEGIDLAPVVDGEKSVFLNLEPLVDRIDKERQLALPVRIEVCRTLDLTAGEVDADFGKSLSGSFYADVSRCRHDSPVEPPSTGCAISLELQVIGGVAVWAITQDFCDDAAIPLQ